MQSHTKLISLFTLVCLISSASVGSGQEVATKSVSAANTELSFPYMAEITDDNVNIRSGPGTNYYHCGKLKAGDKVKVVASKYSWSHIVPPQGSFSWISKQYVSVHLDNPEVGTVTGDAVRVYAGSDLLKPIHSTTVQLHLNKKDMVKLLGEEIDDYYKIVPPTGAYLWVLTQYTRPIGSLRRVSPIVEPPVEVETYSPPVVRASTAAESKQLKKYYALAKQIESERVKLIEQQNYEKIKKKLAEIAGDKEAGKAARYAELVIKQIERYELALTADKEVQLQDSQLRDTSEQIEKAKVEQLAEVPDLGQFTAIGRFQISTVFGPEEELKHYFITDTTGQIICYALPEGPALGADLSEFVGLTVGLVGTVEPYPQTKNALVRFTKIFALN